MVIIIVDWEMDDYQTDDIELAIEKDESQYTTTSGHNAEMAT